MSIEQTLSIIKPDAVSNGYVDEICTRLTDSGLSIIEKKRPSFRQRKGGRVLY
jgi:nucleoside diphosphate kinase